MERAKTLIIGGGIAGLSTAWHLARRGEGPGTVLVEREAHLASHSTALNAAIFRRLCGDAITTAIAERGGRFLLDPPPGFSDVPLVERTGLVLAATGEAAEALRDWIKGHGASLRHEILSASRLRTLLPAFDGRADVACLFPDEGRIDIAALTAGFAAGARAGGVSIRRGAAVAELLRNGDRIDGARLADGAEIEAETTVLAAGGWAAGLGARAGSRVELRPTRRHLLITEVDARIDRRWPVLWRLGPDAPLAGTASEPADGEFYCRPESGGLLLCGCEIDDVDPDACLPEARVRERIAARARGNLVGVEGLGVAHFWCGMRTMSADGRFAIGPDPDLAGLFWVAGLAGAGMVCSAEVGRMADARLHGEALDGGAAEAIAPARLASPRRA